MPKSRNRSSKAIKRQVFGKFRGMKQRQTEMIVALQSLGQTANQHAAVVNGQRDKIAKQEIRISLLEEHVYASLTPDERERLADIIDPPPVESEPAEGGVIASTEETTPPANAEEGSPEQPAAAA